MNSNLKTLVRQNHRLLNTLRCQNGLDKTRLSKILDVTWPTISKNVDELKQNKILKIQDTNEIKINPTLFTYVGLSIGSAQIKLAFLDNNFDLFTPELFSSHKKALSELIMILNPESQDSYIYFSTPSSLFELKNSLDLIFGYIIKQRMELNIAAMGIVATGAVDTDKQIVVKSHNLDYLSGMALSNLFFEDKLALFEKNDIFISLGQNSTAACIAEKYYLYKSENVYSKRKNIISLYLGAGIGSGIILENKIYNGSSGYAGEIGHISVPCAPCNLKEVSADTFFIDSECSCGNINCFDYRIRTDVFKKNKSEFSNMTTDEIYTYLSSADNEEYRKILGDYLGYITNLIMNFLNPDLIIFTGKFYKSMDIMWKYIAPVRDANKLRFIVNDCTMITSSLGALSPAIGAAIHAYHKMLDIDISWE